MKRESAYKYLNKVYLSTKNDSYRDALSVALSALRPASRDQVVKVWRGEWEHDGPKIRGGTDWYHCSNCCAMETGVYVKYNFCSRCGAPMTDEAVDMVMERLEDLVNGK